jgi:tol-pal system protein YbgF
MKRAAKLFLGGAACLAVGLSSAQEVGRAAPVIEAVDGSALLARQAGRVDALAKRLDGMVGRIDDLERQVQSQGVLTLHNQVAEVKAEVARLRGVIDELQHRQTEADKRVKDFYNDLDSRLKALAKSAQAPAATRAEPVAARPAPTGATTPAGAATPGADPEAESKAYEAALSLLKEGNYAGAAQAFQRFLQTYPNAALAANALYWQGLAQFSLGDFKGAVATQQRLIKDYANSPKAPDGMVNMARALLQLGDTEAARRALERVVTEHPASKAADTARKMQELTK